VARLVHGVRSRKTACSIAWRSGSQTFKNWKNILCPRDSKHTTFICKKKFSTAAIIWSLKKVVRNMRNEISQVNRCKHASERGCLQPCSTGRSYYGKNIEYMYLNYKLVLAFTAEEGVQKKRLLSNHEKKKLVAAGQITINRAARKSQWIRILILSKKKKKKKIYFFNSLAYSPLTPGFLVFHGPPRL